jgi:hypothetical protein
MEVPTDPSMLILLCYNCNNLHRWYSLGMYFAIEENDLLPGVLGGTANAALAAVETLLVILVLLALVLWILRKIVTRNDPPNDPLHFS